jgi:hypothetical protein
MMSVIYGAEFKKQISNLCRVIQTVVVMRESRRWEETLAQFSVE